MPLLLQQRGKDKPRLTRDQTRAARRVSELRRIYQDQYSSGLPHNGLGVKYAKYMLRTMAFLPNDRREEWLDRHGAWIDAPTRAYLLKLGAYWYADRSLGQKLELYDQDREKLEAWSVEAVDVNEEQRQMINSEKNRKAQERRRRKNGAKPRADSLSQTKPWADEGISRRTWERRRRKSGDASPSRPSLSLSVNDDLASSSKPQGAAILPAAPREPSGPPPWPRETPDMPQQEPVAPSEPQAATTCKIIPFPGRKPQWATPRIWEQLPDGTLVSLQDVYPLRLAA
jgi:hypothetical protein